MNIINMGFRLARFWIKEIGISEHIQSHDRHVTLTFLAPGGAGSNILVCISEGKLA